MVIFLTSWGLMAMGLLMAITKPIQRRLRGIMTMGIGLVMIGGWNLIVRLILSSLRRAGAPLPSHLPITAVLVRVVGDALVVIGAVQVVFYAVRRWRSPPSVHKQ